MNKEAKKWHNSVKKLTRYTKPSNILDLNQGPIAIRSEWKEAKEGTRLWENVRNTRDQEEIEEQQW